MGHVILCQDVAALDRHLTGIGALRWISLLDTANGARVQEILRSRAGAEELRRGDLFCKRRDDFRRRYIEVISRVNVANGSTFWWAMPFTTKNPLSTSLCRDTFNFLLIADLVEDDPRPLVVITGSEHLAAQLRHWGRTAGVHVIGRVRASGRGWRARARRIPGVTFAFTAGRTWWLWRRARRVAPRPLPRPTVGLVTLLHAHSFTEDGEYRDAYFGGLPGFLAERGVPAAVFGLIFEGRGERLTDKLRGLRSALPVVPIDALLRGADVARCVAHAAGRFLRPFAIRGATEIGGRDVRRLLERAVVEACRSGMFLANVKFYYAGRRLAAGGTLARCLYPYENRAFEKMLMTGVRQTSPATRLLGYNHASITQSHTNFMLGRDEARVMPLPDRVLTLGPVVHDVLAAEGQYPAGVLEVACALRQRLPVDVPARPRATPIRDVLVVLATSLDEYVRTLTFLDQACRQGSPQLRIRVRPHPTIALADAVAIAPLIRRDFFVADQAPLAESLERADIVLYASSTVGLEAVAQGIPAIYLDLHDFMETDPMMGWGELKWIVRAPEDLADTLRAIDAIPDAAFRDLQAAGCAYATAYLRPVTETRLRTFTEA